MKKIWLTAILAAALSQTVLATEENSDDFFVEEEMSQSDTSQNCLTEEFSSNNDECADAPDTQGDDSNMEDQGSME